MEVQAHRFEQVAACPLTDPDALAQNHSRSTFGRAFRIPLRLRNSTQCRSSCEEESQQNHISRVASSLPGEPSSTTDNRRGARESDDITVPMGIEVMAAISL